MKSLELQKLVTNIFKSEETRKQFSSNPGSVIEQYRLTDQERKAVLNLQSNIGIVSSDSPQIAAAIKATFDWFSVPVE